MKDNHFAPVNLCACFTAILLLLATNSPAWAQQPLGAASADRHLGEVVNVTDNQITILTESGENKTFDVSQDARVFLDGQNVKLQDLNQGDEVLLRVNKAAPQQAVVLRAFREQQEQTTPLREARRPGPETRRPVLGVIIQETEDQKGVKVLRVRPDGPAAKAGVQPGDILLSLNDQNIDSPGKLNELIREKKPGDKLNVKIMRNGQEQSVEATLISRREALSRITERQRAQRRQAGREDYPEESQEETDQQRAWLGVFIDEAMGQQGVEVLRVFPGGPADRAGLQTGDIVLSIAEKDIASPSDVVNALKALQPGQTAKMVILRNNEEQTLEVKAGDRSRFLRDQRRFREDTPFRGGERFGSDRMGRFGGAMPGWEQDRFDPEQRQRLEQLGQDVLRELRALRKDVQQLQEEISDQAPEQH